MYTDLQASSICLALMPLWKATGLSGSALSGSSLTTGCRPPSTASLPPAGAGIALSAENNITHLTNTFTSYISEQDLDSGF